MTDLSFLNPILGLTLEEANNWVRTFEAKIRGDSVFLRAIWKNGKHLAVTDDYCTSRVNVGIDKNGRVVQLFTVG